MSRTVAEDLLQSFRFRVFEIAGEASVFENEDPVAGFNTVTTPNITIETAEHRTGSEVFTKKYPGVPTVEDMTMTRGIALGDTTFYDWVMEKYLKRSPFRTDLQVRLYNQEKDGTVIDDQHARQLTCSECIPQSVKLMGDLDASSSDVNLQEVTVALEEIELDAPDSV
jgi:phage tail-like protein